MSPITIQEKKAWLIGLVIECPLGEIVEDCAIQPLRGMPLNATYDIVCDLPESEVTELLACHQRCFEKRCGQTR